MSRQQFKCCRRKHVRVVYALKILNNSWFLVALMLPSWHYSNVLKPQHHSPIRYWWGVKSFSINGAAIRAWQSQEENKMLWEENVQLCSLAACLRSRPRNFDGFTAQCFDVWKVSLPSSWSLSTGGTSGHMIAQVSYAGESELPIVEHDWRKANQTELLFFFFFSFFKAIPLYLPLIFLLTTQSTSNTSVSISGDLFESKPIKLRLLQTLIKSFMQWCNLQLVPSIQDKFCCALGKLKFSSFGEKAVPPSLITLGEQNGGPSKWWLLCLDPFHWTCECLSIPVKMA